MTIIDRPPTTALDPRPAGPGTPPPAATPPATPPEADAAAPVPLEAVAFHRVARARGARRVWFRPLVALGVSALAFGVMFAQLTVVLAVLSMLSGVPLSESAEDPLNPIDQAFGLGSLALLVPAVLIGTLAAYGRARLAVSVTGRFRWGLMGRVALVVVPVYVAVNLVANLVLFRGEITVPALTAPVVLAWVLALVLGPLQSAGEEFAFRALPMQMLGTWLRSPLWGILLPLPLFVVGHGYDLLGLSMIALFGLSAGLLAWKTGGLEIPILVHAVNNTTLFAIAPLLPGFTEQGAVTLRTAGLTAVPLLVLTVGIWVWFSRREGLRLLEPMRAVAANRPTARTALPGPVSGVATTLER